MHIRIAVLAGIGAAAGLSAVAAAQERKPTAKETAVIRDCAKKYRDDVTEGERKCLFKVSDRCAKTPEGKSNVGTADCFRLEQASWDDLLNDNFKSLRDDLDDDEQKTKLREMQRAWITYRDTTCEF